MGPCPEILLKTLNDKTNNKNIEKKLNLSTLAKCGRKNYILIVGKIPL